MVSTEEAEDQLFKKHQNLINNLKLDVTTASQAWENFQSIRTNFTLEGDPLHWIGCAIFVACRKRITPTVGGNVVEGCCVSLTSLLRYCNLSLRHFFNKIEKWTEMANLSMDFRRRIEALESNFSVSCNIFRQFVPMFCKIFKEPNEVDIGNKHRNRKQKCPPCTPTQLFEFCWLLFITIKGQDSSCSVDFVVSLHLLMACCDLAFKNALLDNRRDLLNENFEGLPEDYHNPNYVPLKAPCIIDLLCGLHDKNMVTEAKYVKQYSWKNLVKNLIDKDQLYCNVNDFTGLLYPNNFEANFRTITKVYESNLLHKGDFDERIFLAEHRRLIIIRESLNGASQIPAINDSGETDAANMSFGEMKSRVPDTPLTNRRYLTSKEPTEDSNAVAKNQSAGRLLAMLSNRPEGVTDQLTEVFSSYDADPTPIISTIINTLSDRFRSTYVQENANMQPDYANQRLQVAVKLFYKFLENILLREKAIYKTTHILNQTEFFEGLFACCLEIVIFSYNTQKKFPWILGALEVMPVTFLKVIELIMKTQENLLTRDTVKHLNMVEEMILETEIWKSTSSFWEILKKHEGDLPKFEDIALPGNMIYGNDKTKMIRQPAENARDLLQSPSPSIVDAFDSPLSNVKKQLFASVKPGQSLLSQNQKTNAPFLLITDNEGNKKLIPFETKVESPPNETSNGSPSESATPKRKGSFNIIFRKIYQLVGVRMDHLCNNLGIADSDLKFKIWTAFENLIRNHIDLFKDRHLDQFLMCVVYIMCKVTSNMDRTFSQIIEIYKTQPQAQSYVYRNVLLFRVGETDEEKIVVAEEKRGSLIIFYNNILMKRMLEFALSSKTKDIHLSPMPALKSLLASPAQQISSNIYIKTLQSPSNNANENAYHYIFARSGSNKLVEINRAIKNSGQARKRLLIENNLSDDPLESSKRLCNRKVQNIIKERKNQFSE